MAAKGAIQSSRRSVCPVNIFSGNISVLNHVSLILRRSTRFLISAHIGRVLSVRDPVEVAVLMDSFTVFVGIQISRQIYWLVAKYTGNFWERLTTHEFLLWTVASSIRPQARPRLVNIAPV
jgi:hypothetical protein